MADVEDLSTAVGNSSPDKDQVEQHVEEEIIHEVVSPDQSWRHDESAINLSELDHVHDVHDDMEDDDHEHDEDGTGKDRGQCGPDVLAVTDGQLDGQQLEDSDDAGIFYLNREVDVKQKISTYEKNSGTHFIVLKKEKGYSQTVEGTLGSTALHSDRMGPQEQCTENPEEFICNECNVVYRSYKSLWQHKRDNHQDKLSCGYCDYSSARMYNIKQHRKRRHPNLPDPFDPSLIDMFPSVYSDEGRFEYQGEDYDDELEPHCAEPPSKRTQFSHRTSTQAEVAGVSESPPSALQYQHGTSAKEVHHDASPGDAYPVGLNTSRGSLCHPGSSAKGQRSQHVGQPSGLDMHQAATMPIFPRITNVVGSSATSSTNSSSTANNIYPRKGISDLKQSLGGSHPTTGETTAQLNNPVTRDRRASHEDVHPRDDRVWNASHSRTTALPGPRHQVLSQRTVTSRDDGSRPFSSQRAIITSCSHPNSRTETAPRGTTSMNSSRDATIVQNRPPTNSKDCNQQGAPRYSALSSVPSSTNRVTVESHRNSGVPSGETRRTAHPSSQQESSPGPQPVGSPSPVTDPSIKKKASTCPSNERSSAPQGAKKTHHFTTVRGILDHHRQGVGLTDFRSLLHNFQIRSITERVVHPDGTRYEIQIDEWKFKRLCWSQKSQLTVPIKFDGTPFMYLGQVLLGCHQGKDKNTGIKRKYREKVARRSLSKDDDYRPTKRLLSPATKKLNCPAVISIKKVVKFPDFKVAVDASVYTRRRKFQEISSIMKQAPENLNPEIKFYLQIPSICLHKNHPVGLEYARSLVPRINRPSVKKMTCSEVMRAAQRIGSFVNVTPIHRSSIVDQLTGRNVLFKAELLQKTGSFKVRGALNAILCLKERNVPVKGVVTHSSGNHGQGLAYAAQLTGMPCAVVVPDNTPAVKIQAIMNYGADVVFCEPTQSSRKETCARIQEEKDFHFVSPYDDYDVIAGQGTLGLELLEQCPQVQAVLIPTSGGGLASGIATAVKGISKHVKIFCVEPEGKDLEKSLRHGKRMWPNPPQSLQTVADAIRTQQLGKLTFPILKEKAEKDVFTVNDDDIVEAMKFAWTRLKLLVEPAAATGVAAVLSQKMKDMDPAIQNVAVILCGGNVDIERLPWQQKD